MQVLINGLRYGVDIHYTGPRTTSRTAVKNLKSAAIDHPLAIDSYIASELPLGRIAGPYATARVPFLNLICSPIGAVSKKGSTKVRVIHHLSFPFGGDSINSQVSELNCVISSFDDAMKLVVAAGRGAWLSKIDVVAAYRCIPVRSADRHLLGIMWRGLFYFDCVLPMGLASSCAIWEWFATALEWIIIHSGINTTCTHYIDDGFFVCAPSRTLRYATAQLAAILGIYRVLGIPVSVEKLFGPVTRLPYLGIEVDTMSMTARLSDERLLQLQQLLRDWQLRCSTGTASSASSASSTTTTRAAHAPTASATLGELQSLVGILSFAAKVVRPGRIFLRRMLDLVAALDREERIAVSAFTTGTPPSTPRIGSKGKRYRLSAGFILDLQWWSMFAGDWNGISLLYEAEWSDATVVLQLTTDSCETGCGAVCGVNWFMHTWSADELLAASPTAAASASASTSAAADRTTGSGTSTGSSSSSATPPSSLVSTGRSMPYLELLAIVLAASTWGHRWSGRRVLFHCDCEPVVFAVTKFTSPAPRMMQLIRSLFLIAARHSFEFRLIHIAGVDNSLADALSRGDQVRFFQLHPQAALSSTIPLALPIHNW